MNDKRNSDFVASVIIVIFGGGAFGLYLALPALVTGGTWSAALESALPFLVAISATLLAAILLRWTLARRRSPDFSRAAAGAFPRWLLFVFYWLTAAPAILLIVAGLFGHPAGLLINWIWPVDKPQSVIILSQVLFVLVIAAGLAAAWWVWRCISATAPVADPKRDERNHAA